MTWMAIERVQEGDAMAVTESIESLAEARTRNLVDELEWQANQIAELQRELAVRDRQLADLTALAIAFSCLVGLGIAGVTRLSVGIADAAQ